MTKTNKGMTHPSGKKEWDKKTLAKIEKMMFQICHLTGQHYKDEFWNGIVKASALDMFLFLDKLISQKVRDERELISKGLSKLAIKYSDLKKEITSILYQEQVNENS